MGACGTKGKQGEKEKKPGSTPLSNRSGRRESQDSGRAQQQQQQQQHHHHQHPHHSHHGHRAAPPPQPVDQNAIPKLPSRRDDFECIGVEQLVGKQRDQADQLMNSIAVQQCLEVTIRLLRDGAPVNIIDSEGDTPLCHAIVGPAFHTPRGFAVLEYLATPQVLLTSPHCLALCGLLGRVKAMRRLLALGARPTGGELCACVANRDEDEEVETFESADGQKALEELMQVLSVDEVDEEGFTPLLLACKNARHRSGLFFIARGADVTRRDASKCLPLHHAVSMDETKEAVALVTELAKSSESLHAQDNEGDCPLHNAALFGKATFAKILVAQGASPLARNADGRTPLQIAQGKWGGNNELLSALG